MDRGRVFIHIKDKVLEGVSPGGIFGEMALVDQSPRIALARNRILLMLNPAKAEHDKLCVAIEDADRLLLESEATLGQMNGRVDAITRAGRTVLMAEWARVKRGD